MRLVSLPEIRKSALPSPSLSPSIVRSWSITSAPCVSTIGSGPTRGLRALENSIRSPAAACSTASRSVSSPSEPSVTSDRIVTVNVAMSDPRACCDNRLRWSPLRRRPTAAQCHQSPIQSLMARNDDHKPGSASRCEDYSLGNDAVLPSPANRSPLGSARGGRRPLWLRYRSTLTRRKMTLAV